MLIFELVDLVEELACAPQRSEDTVLLALDVTVQVFHEAGQPRHRCRWVPGTQVLSDVVGLVDEGGVLVHQLGDRLDPSAPAVLTHLSPPDPSRDAVGGCRAARRRGGGRRCRGG